MPEIIMLDTHIWFWFINGDTDPIPVSHRKQIEQADRVGSVSHRFPALKSHWPDKKGSFPFHAKPTYG